MSERMNKTIQDLMQKAESICAETRGVYDEILIKLLIKELEQKKEWVGLTEEDDIDWEEGDTLRDLFKAIEAKLKEKNT